MLHHTKYIWFQKIFSIIDINPRGVASFNPRGLICRINEGDYQTLNWFKLFVCLFNLILYVPSTIFQLYRDGSSWVEPVLS